MKTCFADKSVVVTGGSQGIGAALVSHLRQAGARVAVLDLQETHNADLSLICDASDEKALIGAIEKAEKTLGPVDIFVSNAGVLSKSGDALGSDADWESCWRVNVMAHVYAARAVLPGMVARGSGWIVNVASAAGLLNQIGDAAYSATKHAAVSFSESLAITHGADGIGVSVVCPQYVATPLIGLSDADAEGSNSLLTADEVAVCIMQAIVDKKFMVLPHEAVHGFAGLRAQDHDRWIAGMQRLRQRALDETGRADPEAIYRLI